MLKSILFVCLGNICRSPLAQGIAQKIIDDKSLDIFVDSAGTSSWHQDEAPCMNSIKIAKLHGIDISKQKARQVKEEDLKKFDLVVALDKNNFKDLKRLSCENLVLLGDYGNNGDCIPDPYYFKKLEDFEEVYKIIESCVINLIQKEFN